MRFEGSLKTWNAARGFGFIDPRQGGQELFVHISAFPRDARQPAVGETLTFEVETTVEGKKRAICVQRPGSAAPQAVQTRRPRESRRAKGRTGFGTTLVALLLVAVLGWHGYGRYRQQQAVAQITAPVSPGLAAPVREAAGPYSCDGRQYCSEMTSCAEAKFFLSNCPGVKMDGNHDGVPCEQQWCTSAFAD